MTTSDAPLGPPADDRAAEVTTTRPPTDSPGQALQQARRERKLDIASVATTLRLTPKVVEAIERDDYARLPSAVFVSGYIRSYARLVGLDPAPLNQAFRDLHPDAEAPPRHFARSSPAGAGSDAGSLTLYVVTAVIVIALGAGVYAWWTTRPQLADAPLEPAATDPTVFGSDPVDAGAVGSDQGTGPPSPTEPAGPDAAADTAREEIPAQRDAPLTSAADDDREPTPPSPSTALPTGSGALAPDTPAPTAALGDQAAPSTASAQPQDAKLARGEQPQLPTPAAPDAAEGDADAELGTETTPTDPTRGGAGADALETTDPDTGGAGASPGAVTLAFSGPCWVDIRDADGEVLLFGEMSRGDRETLGGQPPYSLVLGNAAAVEVSVGGSRFDVAAIARGNVARFELDPATIDGGSGPDTSPAGTSPAEGATARDRNDPPDSSNPPDSSD